MVRKLKHINCQPIECRECGKFFHCLAPSHLKTHNIKSLQYRLKWKLTQADIECSTLRKYHRQKLLQGIAKGIIKPNLAKAKIKRLEWKKANPEIHRQIILQAQEKSGRSKGLWSEADRKAMSKLRKGIPLSKQTKHRLSLAKTGKHYPKISLARTGKHYPKLSLAQLGKKRGKYKKRIKK